MNHRSLKGQRLRQIEAYVTSSGFTTVTKIANHFDIQRRTVQVNLRELRAEGRVGAYGKPGKVTRETERLWGKPGPDAAPAEPKKPAPVKSFAHDDGRPMVLRRAPGEWPRGEVRRDPMTAALHGPAKPGISRSPSICADCKQTMDQPHLADCTLKPYLPTMNKPLTPDALRVTFQSQDQFEAACAPAAPAPVLDLNADELKAVKRISGTAVSIGALLDVAQLPGIFDGASGVALAMRLTEDLVKDLNAAFGARCGVIMIGAQ